MGSTRPMWVGLDLCDGLGWIEFFWPTMVGWVKKSPQHDQTRPMHTPSIKFRINNKIKLNLKISSNAMKNDQYHST